MNEWFDFYTCILRTQGCFFSILLLTTTIGCDMNHASNPSNQPSDAKSQPLDADRNSTESNCSFSPEDARQALIRMITTDHAEDRLLQAAVPYIRDAAFEPVEDVHDPEDWIKIAAWDCNLKKKTFVGTYATDGTFAEFFGNFVLNDAQQWTGVMREVTRND